MKPSKYHGLVEPMSFAEYQAAPGVSNSMLSKFKRSPAHLQAYLAVRDDEEAAHFKIGRVAHQAILEPDKFADCFDSAYVLRPETYTDAKGEVKKWSGNANSCKDWIKAQAAAGRTVITEAERELLRGAIVNVNRHDMARRVFAERGTAEVSLFCEIDGVLRKGRLDWLPIVSNFLGDVKTTEDGRPEAFARSVWEYGYHRQAAYYLDLANALAVGPHRECFIFVVVEKKAPYAVATYQLDEAAIALGREENADLLRRYKECAERNEWPAYSEKLEMVGLPGWVR